MPSDAFGRMQRCPACREELVGQMLVGESGPYEPPVAGDLTVCAHCAVVCVYEPDLIGVPVLRVTTAEEWTGFVDQGHPIVRVRQVVRQAIAAGHTPPARRRHR